MGKKTAAIVEIIIALLFLRFCVSQILVQQEIALVSRKSSSTPSPPARRR